MTNEEKYQEAKQKLEQALAELNQICLEILDKPIVYTVDEEGNPL